MKQRPLGRTGRTVSEIAFGTGDNAGLMVNATPEQQTRAVRRALELGITYFDTSPDYGKGAAERNLGRILRELGVSPTVATKVEIMPADVDDIEGAIGRSLDDSLARLGLPRVDILMIHNPPRRERDPGAAHWLPLTVDDFLGPALRGLQTARAQGKCDIFGFTCENADAVAVLPVLQSGAFDVINAWYNLVNPTAGRVMPAGVRYGRAYEDYGGIISAAGELGVGVAVIRPLAGGALAPAVVASGVTARHPLAGGLYARNPEAFRPEADRGRAFRFLDRPGRSLPQAAYAFALDHPAVSTVIGGFSDVEQLEELARVEGSAPFTAAERERIEAVYARNFDLGED